MEESKIYPKSTFQLIEGCYQLTKQHEVYTDHVSKPEFA